MQNDIDKIGTSAEDDRARFLNRFRRLKDVLGVKTGTDLAKKLGISQAAVAKAKQRGSIPQSWLYTIATKYGIRAEYILHGSRKDDSIKERIEEQIKFDIINMPILGECIRYIEKFDDAKEPHLDPNSKAILIKLFYELKRKRPLYTDFDFLTEVSVELAKRLTINGYDWPEESEATVD